MSILSRINENVKYIETKLINDEDNGHTSSLYVINIYGEDIIIALGKPKHTFANYNVIYFPIYFVFQDIIELQIGVYEIDIHNTLVVYDKDGDVDLQKLGKPIFYSHLTKSVITEFNLKQNIKFYDDKPSPHKKEKHISEEKSVHDDEEDEIKEID
jgi:hypothetical protein